MLQHGCTLKTLQQVKAAEHKRPQKCMIPLAWNVQDRQNTNTESRLVVVQGRGREEWRVTTNEYRLSFGGKENVLKLDNDVMAAQLWIY